MPAITERSGQLKSADRAGVGERHSGTGGRRTKESEIERCVVCHEDAASGECNDGLHHGVEGRREENLMPSYAMDLDRTER